MTDLSRTGSRRKCRCLSLSGDEVEVEELRELMEEAGNRIIQREGRGKCW